MKPSTTLNIERNLQKKNIYEKTASPWTNLKTGRLGWTRQDPLGPGWTGLDQDGPGQTGVGQAGPDLIRLDKAGPGWTKMDQVGPGWAGLHQAGPRQTRLDPLRSGWTRLDQAGPGWTGHIKSRQHSCPFSNELQLEYSCTRWNTAARADAVRWNRAFHDNQA